MRRDDGDFAELMQSGAVPLPRRANPTRPTRAADAPGASVLPPDSDADAGDYAHQSSYRDNGVSDRDLRALRKQAAADSLDLHGLSVAEAHQTLDDFLAAAQRRGALIVEIIHGRGQHGGANAGVLRGKTRQWLCRCAAVLAYVEIPKNPGAVRARLRR